jgi:septum formation protein
VPTHPTGARGRDADRDALRPAVRLVLASASPARRATLVAAGLDPEVVVSGIDEDAVAGRHGRQPATEVVQLLARAKAEDVARRLGDGGRRSPTGPEAVTLVLGCDSMLELDGELHGKPVDVDESRSRWRRMRGHSGVLHTGHWLVGTRPEGSPTGDAVGAVSSTTVHFAEIDDDELEAYLETGEPLSVAGAFTLDGVGGGFVRGVDGDHHGVVGVSVPLLRELVRRLGLFWPGLWRRSVS